MTAKRGQRGLAGDAARIGRQFRHRIRQDRRGGFRRAGQGDWGQHCRDATRLHRRRKQAAAISGDTGRPMLPAGSSCRDRGRPRL